MTKLYTMVDGSTVTAAEWQRRVQFRMSQETCLHGTAAGLLPNGKARLVGANCSGCKEINRQYANRDRSRHNSMLAGMYGAI